MTVMSAMTTKTIGVKPETYSQLVGLSTSKNDTFDSIIKRLISQAGGQN